MTPNPPYGFVAIRTARASAWVRPDARAWVEKALARDGSIYDAAGRPTKALAGGAGALHGRAPIRLVAEGRGPGEPVWAVRHYRRGGWMAPLLGDRYLRLGGPRPLLETVASELLCARGIPTPRVVAAAVYPVGPVYRADLVTELVPDTVDLGRFLFESESARLGGGTADGGGAASLRLAALEGAGRLVRAIAEAGARHADLNVKNLLVRLEPAREDGSTAGALPPSETRPPILYVVDLDRCEPQGHAPERAADAMGRRLLRSIAAWEARTGRPLRPGEREALLRGIGLQLHGK